MTTRFEQQSQEFKEMLDEIYELFIRKGKDYGTQDDHFANLRESARIFMPDKPDWLAPQIRMLDKLFRVLHILNNGGKAANESIRDSLRDMCVYQLNSYKMYLEEQDKK